MANYDLIMVITGTNTGCQVLVRLVGSLQKKTSALWQKKFHREQPFASILRQICVNLRLDAEVLLEMLPEFIIFF